MAKIKFIGFRPLPCGSTLVVTGEASVDETPISKSFGGFGEGSLGTNETLKRLMREQAEAALDQAERGD